MINAGLNAEKRTGRLGEKSVVNVAKQRQETFSICSDSVDRASPGGRSKSSPHVLTVPGVWWGIRDNKWAYYRANLKASMAFQCWRPTLTTRCLCATFNQIMDLNDLQNIHFLLLQQHPEDSPYLLPAWCKGSVRIHTRKKKAEISACLPAPPTHTHTNGRTHIRERTHNYQGKFRDKNLRRTTSIPPKTLTFLSLCLPLSLTHSHSLSLSRSRSRSHTHTHTHRPVLS